MYIFTHYSLKYIGEEFTYKDDLKFIMVWTPTMGTT